MNNTPLQRRQGTWHRMEIMAAVIFTTLLIRPSLFEGQVIQDFTAPMLDGRRLDLCLVWGEQCGQPAADAFCQAQGFDQASAWTLAENIGATEPTVVMTSREVCSDPDCDAFASITCTRPAPPSRTTRAGCRQPLRLRRLSSRPET